MSETNKFIEVKEFTGNVEKTKILIDRTPKKSMQYFDILKKRNKELELPLELLKDLYIETKDNKVLIFLIAEEGRKRLQLNSKKFQPW